MNVHDETLLKTHSSNVLKCAIKWQNLEGSSGGVRIATLAYNAAALPNDPFHAGWAV